MRKIFTFFLLLISSISFSQVNDRIVLPGFDTSNQTQVFCHNLQPCGMVRRYAETHGSATTAKQDSSAKRICTRCVNKGDPLYVLNGIAIVKTNETELSLKEIEGISVLKGVEAMAIFGYLGINGVIIITTKKSLIRKFIIKDSLKGKRMKDASVSFLSVKNRNDKIQLVSNDSGEVATDKLKMGKEYKVIINSIGYKPFIALFRASVDGPTKEFLLEKDIINFNNTVSGMKIFPNPVPSGSDLNIGCRQTEEGYYTVQLVSQSGHSMYQQEIWIDAEARILTIHIPAVAAGSYFLLLTSKKSQKGVAEKVLVK